MTNIDKALDQASIDRSALNKTKLALEMLNRAIQNLKNAQSSDLDDLLEEGLTEEERTILRDGIAKDVAEISAKHHFTSLTNKF